MSHNYYKIRIQQGDVAFEVEATNPEFATAQLNKLSKEVLGIIPVESPSRTPASVSEKIIEAPPVSFTVETQPIPPLSMEQPTIVPEPIYPQQPEAMQAASLAPEMVTMAPEDPQFDAFMDTLLSDLDNPASEIKLPFEESTPLEAVPTHLGSDHSPEYKMEQPGETGETGLSSLNLSDLKNKKIQSFESVFNEAQLQLDVSSNPPTTAGEETNSPPAETENILFNAKGHNLTAIETLQELCEVASKAKTAEDFLLLTGYFLQEYKATRSYSLKLINTELVRTGLTPINHAILENTVTLGLIAMIPDLTGNAQSTEYELTPQGLEHVKHLLDLV